MVGWLSIIGGFIVGGSFVSYLSRKSHITLHHEGILLLSVCAIALGMILILLAEFATDQNSKQPQSEET